MIGGSPVNPIHRFAGTRRAGRPRVGAAILRHKPDGLEPTHVLAIGGLNLVSQGRQLFPDLIKQIRFQAQSVGRLRMSKPRRIAGRLGVGSQVQHVHEHLLMPLCLLAAPIRPNAMSGRPSFITNPGTSV